MNSSRGGGAAWHRVAVRDGETDGRVVWRRVERPFLSRRRDGETDGRCVVNRASPRLSALAWIGGSQKTVRSA
jgi:hypothetical protein